MLTQSIGKFDIFKDFESEKLKLEHMINIYKVEIDLTKQIQEMIKKTNGEREKELAFFQIREKIFEHIAKSAIKQTSEVLKFVSEERDWFMKDIQLW